jgi:hypothetical protein
LCSQHATKLDAAGLFVLARGFEELFRHQRASLLMPSSSHARSPCTGLRLGLEACVKTLRYLCLEATYLNRSVQHPL